MPVEQGHTCYISTCPRHKRRLKLGDTGTLYINMTTGNNVTWSFVFPCSIILGNKEKNIRETLSFWTHIFVFSVINKLRDYKSITALGIDFGIIRNYFGTSEHSYWPSIDSVWLHWTLLLAGYFVCKACRKSGSWNTLQDNIAFILESIKEKRR